jgi:membrane protease YdiL (CAAX protease family)
VIAGFDRRVWMVIAFATFVATFAGAPYGEFLIAGGPAAGLGRDPLTRLALHLVFTVFGLWPLAALGLMLGARVGLGAPLLAAWFGGEPVAARARGALGPAVMLGFGLGTAFLLLFTLGHGAASAQLLGRTPVAPPAWAGVLAAFSAGITEEVLLRLFLMSALAVLFAAMLPRGPALWTANAVAALVFGALHFGNVFALGIHFDLVVALSVLGLNGAFGLLCGWLYATRGLEAAMAAHTACDLVLHGLGATLGGPR